MTKTVFQNAVAKILKKEGGYVDHPRDNGGPTNFGITYKTLAKWRGVHHSKISKDDVRRLSRQEAIDIYRAKYWTTCRCDELPEGLALAVFDFAVNSGPARAAKFLQRIVGAKVDGIIGGMTLKAVKRWDEKELIVWLQNARLQWLEKHEDWDVFGRGWTNRINQIKDEALSIAKG